MIADCEVVVRPDQRPPYESSSPVTPIRPSGGTGTDVLTTNNEYSGTFKKTAPRIVKMLSIELDRETDGRWIAEVPAIPGVMVYGSSREDAVSRVRELAVSALTERREEEPDIFGVRHTFLTEYAA
jgi:predicted RNase H-like HicB family nuclease